MAIRSGFDGSLLDVQTGTPLADVECTVLNSSGTNATIYETRVGGALKSNPFNTTANGVVNFFAEPGYYDIQARDTHIPARFTTRRIPFDAVSGDDNGIALKQIDINNKIDQSMFQADSVGTSELKMYTSLGAGSTTTTSSQTLVSLSSIPPGIYQVTTVVALGLGGKPGFEITSGTGTWYQVTPGSGINPTGYTTLVGILEVTATAAIRFYGQPQNGPVTHSMAVFGVAA